MNILLNRPSTPEAAAIPSPLRAAAERRKSLHDFRTGSQDPGLVGGEAGRKPGRLASLNPEHPAPAETGLRAAASDPLAFARADPEGLGGRRTGGSSFDLHPGQTYPKRGAVGGPEGDNGLSGKKLVIDHYGPGVPIGGGALAGKDPHKVDKCGALRARQLAKKLVRGGVDEARVPLGWTAPRKAEHRFRRAETFCLSGWDGQT